MRAQQIDPSTQDLAAAVAAREGWDPDGPAPDRHGPRTLDEERAVALMHAGAQVAAGRPRVHDPARRARLITVGLIVLVLGVCWWISPERTALALIVAGLMCLVAMRRRSRRSRPG
ncbi:MAG: hypothetical protein RJQ03_01235, partial [Miltoncostaeaceae bacterium]